jgi:hypothetical protein
MPTEESCLGCGRSSMTLYCNECAPSVARPPRQTVDSCGVSETGQWHNGRIINHRSYTNKPGLLPDLRRRKPPDGKRKI